MNWHTLDAKGIRAMISGLDVEIPVVETHR